jgi:flagellar hook-associated protein 2
MADATFRAGGLASGIDTNSLIEQLTAIEARPISLLRNRQAGLQSQISTIGGIISKLGALKDAANALSTGGTLATKVDGTNTQFSAVSGAGALAGQHSLRVETLATAAMNRSTNFDTTTTPVRGGTLTFTVMGKAYDPVTIADGASLADVAFAIRQAGIPVTATVINDGSQNYLSIVNNATGSPLDGGAAMSIVENYTGNVANKQLALNTWSQAPTNSKVHLNGLAITRTSNSISDLIPGVTLSLKSTSLSAETLNVATDTGGTATNVKKFVDAYNAVMATVQGQLNVSATSDRASSLAGDSTLRSLQRTLRDLVTTTVGATTVRSLADIGVKTGRDGMLTVDNTVLEKAITRDPASVNALFATASTGMAEITKSAVDRYTRTTDGLLISRKSGLESNIKRIDTDIVTMETRVEKKRDALIAQFSAMEKIVSRLKATGNFLSQQQSAITGG